MLTDQPPKFHRIKGNTSFMALAHSNLGLYVHKKRGVLIDSGYTEEDANWIAELLESDAIKLEAILNTHAHPDNSGGSFYLKKRTGCKVYASAAQRPLIENPSRSNYLAMLQAVVDKEREESEKQLRHALKAENSNDVELKKESFETADPPPETSSESETTLLETDHRPAVIKPKPCVVDGTLDPQKPFVMSTGKQIQIVDLSGHVMGMYGVITPDEVLFLGDALYTFDELAEKPIPYLESVELFKKSLDYLLTTPYAHFIPTHGRPLDFSISAEVLFHQRQIEMIEEAILLHLQMPRTREELVALLFATFSIEETIPNFYMMSSTIISFLNYLKRTRRISIIHEDGKTRWYARQK